MSIDAVAKEVGISVIGGASMTCGLSSAFIEHFRAVSADINPMTFGISPGQKAERGLATTA